MRRTNGKGSQGLVLLVLVSFSVVMLQIVGCGRSTVVRDTSTTVAEDPAPALASLALAPSLDAGDGEEGVEEHIAELAPACAVVEELQRGAGALLAKFPEEVLLLDRLTPEILPCVLNPDGKTAWSAVVREAAPEPDGEWADDRCCFSGQSDCALLDLRLVFVDEQGEASFGPWKPFSSSVDCHYGFSKLRFFDFDGDGANEVAWQEDNWEHEGGPLPTPLELMTFQDGVVQRYAPSRSLSARGLKDIDSDGRPDLILDFDYAIEMSGSTTPSGSVPLSYGPLWIAHSLPDGTFTTEDAVAHEPLLQQCPDVPTQIRPALQDGVLDNELLKQNLVCALLWGQAWSAYDAVRHCQSKQESFVTDVTNDGKPVFRRLEDPSKCSDASALEGWLDQPIPTTLGSRDLQ